MKTELITIRGTDKFDSEYITYGAEADRILHDYSEYEKFVKGCEHAVRKEDRYTSYIAELKKAGMTRCAILGNIKEDSKVKLEMHHGPIFNLFDICDIVTRALLRRGLVRDLTTYDVGHLVLEEHRLNNIMIVMLSKTVHRGGHNKKGPRSIFVDIKATFGRIDRFIDKYTDGMEEEHWSYLERYIRELKKTNGTVDNGLFDTAEKLIRFK